MNYTDMTIEITCSECEKIIAGIDSMAAHIMQEHQQYTAQEAIKYAQDWAEAAYEKQDQWEYDHLSASQQRAYRATQNGR